MAFKTLQTFEIQSFIVWKFTELLEFYIYIYIYIHTHYTKRQFVQIFQKILHIQKILHTDMYIYIHIYIYVYIYICTYIHTYISGRKWSLTHGVLKSHRRKISIIYMLSWKHIAGTNELKSAQQAKQGA